MLLKFFKFGLVGILGLIIDFSLTYLCKERLRWNRYLANSIGFISATTSNYYFNRIWTFQSKDPNLGQQYSSFVLVALVGLAINNTVLFLFEKHTRLGFYGAKVVAIGVTVIWNFLANYFITFNN